MSMDVFLRAAEGELGAEHVNTADETLARYGEKWDGRLPSPDA